MSKLDSKSNGSKQAPSSKPRIKASPVAEHARNPMFPLPSPVDDPRCDVPVPSPDAAKVNRERAENQKETLPYAALQAMGIVLDGDDNPVLTAIDAMLPELQLVSLVLGDFAEGSYDINDVGNIVDRLCARMRAMRFLAGEQGEELERFRRAAKEVAS